MEVGTSDRPPVARRFPFPVVGHLTAEPALDMRSTLLSATLNSHPRITRHRGASTQVAW